MLDDMLLYFPELMETYHIFQAEVETKSGFANRTYLPDTTGILQYQKGGGTDINTGVVYEYEQPYYWTRDILPNLAFIEKNTDLYRITGNNDWKREGNFYRYDLKKWEGITDTQKQDNDIITNEQYL